MSDWSNIDVSFFHKEKFRSQLTVINQYKTLDFSCDSITCSTRAKAWERWCLHKICTRIGCAHSWKRHGDCSHNGVTTRLRMCLDPVLFFRCVQLGGPNFRYSLIIKTRVEPSVRINERSQKKKMTKLYLFRYELYLSCIDWIFQYDNIAIVNLDKIK